MTLYAEVIYIDPKFNRDGETHPREARLASQLVKAKDQEQLLVFCNQENTLEGHALRPVGVRIFTGMDEDKVREVLQSNHGHLPVIYFGDARFKVSETSNSTPSRNFWDRFGKTDGRLNNLGTVRQAIHSRYGLDTSFSQRTIAYFGDGLFTIMPFLENTVCKLVNGNPHLLHIPASFNGNTSTNIVSGQRVKELPLLNQERVDRLLGICVTHIPLSLPRFTEEMMDLTTKPKRARVLRETPTQNLTMLEQLG